MRTISRTTRFKKDYKRESKGEHRITLDADLVAVVELLANSSLMPEKLRDHPLLGEWKDHRDCHIKPDSLELVRLGSHSELSL